MDSVTVNFNEPKGCNPFQLSLELQEAKMLSPARMEELARQQQFVDPEPAKVVYLDSKDGSSLALNQKH